MVTKSKLSVVQNKHYYLSGNFSITGKARVCIKRYLQIKEDDDFKKLGKEIIINQFKNQNMRYSENNIKSILEKFKVNNIEELFKLIEVEIFNENYFINVSRKKILKQNDKIIILDQVKENKGIKTRPLIVKGLMPGMSIYLRELLQSYAQATRQLHTL